MTTFEHFRGGVIGLFLGALVTPILSLIAVFLFYKGGGFVIDFAPAAILFFSIIWGVFSGAILGLLLLRQKVALIAGLILAFLALLLLFLTNIIEKGFSRTVDLWFNDGSFFNIGVFCFFAITILSSYVIATVNGLLTKDQT